MAIGNMNYVRKYYGPRLRYVELNFDALLGRFDQEHPRHKPGRLAIGLETHRSRNRTAWHGVFAWRDESGMVRFRPKSFYGGYAFMTLNNEDVA